MTFFFTFVFSGFVGVIDVAFGVLCRLSDRFIVIARGHDLRAPSKKCFVRGGLNNTKNLVRIVGRVGLSPRSLCFHDFFRCSDLFGWRDRQPFWLHVGLYES